MSGTPTLFLLVGMPVSSKITTARQLESERRAVRFSPDEWMLPLFGASDPDGERGVLEGRFIWTAHRVLLAGADAVCADSCTIFCDLDEDERPVRFRRRQREKPTTTFVMTDADHARHRSLFEPPSAAEIAGDETRDPPPPHTDWLTWAAERWPSLPVLSR